MSERASCIVAVSREPLEIYIGRSMPRYPELRAAEWGNPFTARKVPPGYANAVQAYQQYRQWIMRQPRLLGRIGELRGKTLGCWCAPPGGLTGDLHGHTCHGEVLAALARCQITVPEMKPISRTCQRALDNQNVLLYTACQSIETF